jgi:hypothetical protein
MQERSAAVVRLPRNVQTRRHKIVVLERVQHIRSLY